MFARGLTPQRRKRAAAHRVSPAHTGAMHGSTTGITPHLLAAHLREAYGLPIAAIARVPNGEDADAYRATTDGGTPYFIRVQSGSTADHLEVALAATAVLHARCGLTAIVAPLATTRGAFTSRLATATVAVFPFVAGETAYDRALGDADWQRLAAIMGTIHDRGLAPHFPTLPRETFSNPFAATIRRALQHTDSANTRWSPWQRQMGTLLQAQRADLEATMRQFARRGDLARRMAISMVPTHGDPNLANVLIGNTGTLHIIDWGELAHGPPERDLMFFTGDRLSLFLETYLAHAGPMRLHLELFAFYLYRWALQEIADYAADILLAPADEATQAHAWQEVQPYLPVPHAAIAAEIEEVRRALAPLARAGQIDMRIGESQT